MLGCNVRGLMYRSSIYLAMWLVPYQADSTGGEGAQSDVPQGAGGLELGIPRAKTQLETSWFSGPWTTRHHWRDIEGLRMKRGCTVRAGFAGSLKGEGEKCWL